MLLLVVSFGPYMRVLWCCWYYLVLLGSLLQIFRFNLESDKKPGSFLDFHDKTLALLKDNKGRCHTFFSFLLKMTF